MSQTQISAKFYTKEHILTSSERLLEIEVRCSNEIVPRKDPITITIVADVSGSMKKIRDQLVGCLLAFDDVFRSTENITVNVITFASEAQSIYSGRLSDAYRLAVKEIRCDGLTNYEAALTEALIQKEETDGYHFTIFFTDGHVTDGNIQTPKEVEEFIRKLGDVATIGLGTEYCPKMLQVMGEFTPVDSLAKVSEVIGAIAGSLVTTFKTGVRISSDAIFPSRTVVGSSYVGRLFSGRVFYWILSVDEDHFEDVKNARFGLKGVDTVCNVTIVNDIPDSTLRRYYEASSYRLIECAFKNPDFVKDRIALWLSQGDSAKVRVLNAIKGLQDPMETCRGLSSCRSQMDYGNTAFLTEPQRYYSSEAKNNFERYTD